MSAVPDTRSLVGPKFFPSCGVEAGGSRIPDARSSAGMIEVGRSRPPASRRDGRRLVARGPGSWTDDGRRALLDAAPSPELADAAFVVGDWTLRNVAFATPTTPDRERDVDGVIQWCRAQAGFGLACLTAGNGRPAAECLIYDTNDGRWMNVTVEPKVAYILLTADGCHDGELCFAGAVRILGETVELRHRLVRADDDHWKWANDEAVDGDWIAVDEHRLTRTGATPSPDL